MAGSWFDTITPKSEWQRMSYDINTWGRNTFSSSFASGGVAAQMFAPTAKQRMAAAASNIQTGSSEHIQNLRRMASMPDADRGKINEAISKMERKGVAKKSLMRSAAGGLFGVGMAGLMIAAPMISAEGGPREKLEAGVTGAADLVGWGIGAHLGKIAGAAVRMPGVGSFAGGMGFGSIAAFGAEKAIEFGKYLEGKGSRNRMHGWKWGQQNGAFYTKRASTMRQQSLEMMNRGMMSSRNLLGQEAGLVHR